MDTFTYFQADHAHIERRLNDLTSNYTRLSAGQVQEQARRIFDAINVHFDKQEVLLLAHIRNLEGLQGVIEECRADRRRITEAIEDAVSLHIDDPDFNKEMKKVLKLIEDHIRFSDHDLYEQIRKHAPAEVIEEIDNKLSETILS